MQAESVSATWIVIAAYNEASVIAGVVGGLIQHGYTVAVVDDGSTDRTGALAGSAGATVVPHPINLGQGAALQTGITYALRHGASHICTFDADGQHAPETIDAIAQMIEPGVSLIVSDQGLGDETGEGTDFVVVTR